MRGFVRSALRFGFLLTATWAAVAGITVRRRQKRLAIADCPANHPDCHGNVGLTLELERPDCTETVFTNEFVLQGHITLQSNTPVAQATLLIQGRPPSTLPFKEIDLMNGELGRVVRPQGGRFLAVIKNQLFCAAAQLVPYRNDITVFVVDAAGAHVEGAGTVINLSCLFINPSGPSTE